MLELWAFITRQRVVYLQDFDGHVTKTVAKSTPFGLVAKRWWPFSIIKVVLLPNGEVLNGEYVSYWKESKMTGKLFKTNKDTYLFTYFSKGNLTSRSKVAVQANTLVEAQDLFFEYIKGTALYSHMWNIEVTCEKIEGSVL